MAPHTVEINPAVAQAAAREERELRTQEQRARVRFERSLPVRWARHLVSHSAGLSGIRALLRAENGVSLIPPLEESQLEAVIEDARLFALAVAEFPDDPNRPDMFVERVANTRRFNLTIEGATVQLTVDQLRSWPLVERELISQVGHVPYWLPAPKEKGEVDPWRSIADDLIANARTITVEDDTAGQFGRALELLRAWLTGASTVQGDLAEVPWRDVRNGRYVLRLDAAHRMLLGSGITHLSREAVARMLRLNFAASSASVWYQGRTIRAHGVPLAALYGPHSSTHSDPDR